MKCNNCNLEKDTSEFYKNHTAKSGLSSFCKKCDGEKAHQRHLKKKAGTFIPQKLRPKPYGKSNTRYYRHSKKLEWLFGIGLPEFEEILKSQNHCCAICGKPQSSQKRRFSVDHSHETGKIRAILCDNCNHGLGNFKDNIKNLENAINYLKEHT